MKPKPEETPAVVEDDQETNKNKSSLSDSDFGSGGKVIRGFQGGEFLQQVRRLQERAAASGYNYAAGSQQQLCDSSKEQL
eukprot:GSA120T00008192001.1